MSQPTEAFNLDGILGELGSFGKYQLFLLLLLSYRDAFLAMCNYHYVFTAEEAPFRCEVPECDYTDPAFKANWTSFALPPNTETCYRMVPLPGDEWNSTAPSQQWLSNNTESSSTCSPEYFSNRTMGCDKLVYEKHNSIVAEFNLGCEPWKRTMIGTVHNLGLIISYILCGIISDRFGRKFIIVGTPLVVGFTGIVKAFSVNYWMLLILEFIESAFGYGNASMVLSLETVSQQHRVMFSSMSTVLCCIGNAFFGLMAWMIPYWRHLMLAIYAPLLVAFFYIFLVDEGVRWLLAHDKKEKAIQVINKVAKYNNVTLSNNAKAMLEQITEKKNVEKVEKEHDGTSHFFAVLRSKTILYRVAIISLTFVCCTFVFNGTIINSTSVVGNKYWNFSILLLSPIPTRLATAYAFSRFGRKKCISFAYCLCCVFFVASAFVPESVGWASLLLYLAGKMCNSFGMFSVTVVTLEVFPTKSRNSLTNVANTIGRIGSVLAPQTPLLEKYMTGLSSIVFGIVSLGPALLVLLLPDTNNAALPDDVAEAEKLGAQKEKLAKDVENAPSVPIKEKL